MLCSCFNNYYIIILLAFFSPSGSHHICCHLPSVPFPSYIIMPPPFSPAMPLHVCFHIRCSLFLLVPFKQWTYFIPFQISLSLFFMSSFPHTPWFLHFKNSCFFKLHTISSVPKVQYYYFVLLHAPPPWLPLPLTLPLPTLEKLQGLPSGESRTWNPSRRNPNRTESSSAAIATSY